MPASLESVRLFNALPTPHLLLSPALVIEAVSESFLHATLTQRAHLVGQYLFDVFPDNPHTPAAHGVHTVRASLLQVLATGQPQRLARQPYDLPDPARPGHFLERYWQALTSPVLDAEGTVIQLIHATVDVTEQELAQARLVESQQDEQYARAEAERQRQRFQEVLVQLPAHVAVYQGPDHVYQFVNPPYQRRFPQRAFLGRPLREAIPETSDLGLVALLDQVYQTGEPYHVQELEGWFDFQGTGQLEQLFLNLTLHPLRDAQGRIDGVLDFSHDVTEQVLARRQVQTLNEELAAINEELGATNDGYRAANAALSEAQQQLQQLNHELEGRVQARTQQLEAQRGELQRVLEQAPVAIWVAHGPTYVLELVNDRMSPMLGLPPAALLGRPLLDVLPELVAPLGGLLRQAWESGEPVPVQELPVHLAPHAAGEVGYFSFVYQPLRDDQGLVDRLACVAVDVTDQVLARQQVQALNQALTATNDELYASNTQLTRTNTDLDTFVYAASHDLKAPIANIEGLLNALRDYLPTEAQEPMVPRLVGMMEGAIARFQQTVGHLTDVSHLQTTQLLHPPEALDLPQVVEDVRLDLLPLLESTRAELAVAVEACPDVRFSVKHLRSVLFNLLSNALKYRHPDRTPAVQVRAHCSATQLVLAVQDNGLGLSETQQGQLFTMFRRLHTHVEGSGVGLYLIKRTIENAGGTIAVQSQPGTGSTFTVTLPRA